MGLLGGGEDSLSASSGWGMMPPINSSSDWGSSSNTGVGGGGSTSSSGLITNHWQSSSNTGSGSAGGAGSSANSTNSNGVNVVGRQNALSNHNSANDQLLSSSPKPSSSWAQAAGKGLVNATCTGASGGASGSSANGPINSSINNSHDQPLSSYSNATATMVANSQQSSASSSSSQSATNANLNGGLVGMSANSSNIASSNPNSSSSAFQSSSNSNTSSSTGGLIGGSSSNPIDAAVVNKQRSGPSGSGSGISDLIGQLSDDFRETLLTEKWGSSVINQDSPWNLPPSPQSSPKDTSTWRCPVNSGTEIWENAVRHKKGSVGGSSAASLSSSVTLSSAQPWGQAPTTHIGGTWGEEEDSSNHWTGVPQSSSLNSVSGGNGSGGNGLSGGFGGAGPSGLSALGGVNSSSINNNWSAGSGLSNGAGSSISGYSLLNSGGLGANSIGSGGLGPPSDNPAGNSWNGCNDKSAFESRSKGASWGGNFDQADSAEPNWDKSMGGGGNDFGTWNAAPEKKDPSWDRDSNDSLKGGVDDGTACWGNPRGGSSNNGNSNNVQRGANVPNWKENNKYGGNKNGFNNGWSGNGNGGGNKSGNNQSSMLNRTWTDASAVHRKSPSLWNDDTKSLNGNMTPNNMSDGQIDTSSWFASKQPKPITREMILSSKQFRLLVDLGFKKDDVENALRNYQMRFDVALMELESQKPLKSHQGALAMNPNVKMQQSNRGQFGGVPGGNGNPPMLNTQSMANNNSQLQNLVQRIQLAVSTGFLNPQILNQPLSNQNLEIISELLHQIKLLKEVQMSASLPNLNAGAKSQLETKSFQIKQTISMLQNQLRPEQPGQGGKMGDGLQSNDYFKSNNDLYGLNNEYGSGSASGGGSQGSRLHSWKQSSYSKQQSNEDKLNALGADFIRAPGGLAKQNSTSSNWGNFMASSDDGWPSDLGQLPKSHEDDYALSNFGQQDFDSYKSSTWKSTAKGLMDDDPRSPISQNSMMKETVFSWTSGSAPNVKSSTLLGGNGNSNAQSQMDSLNSPFGFGTGSNNPWSYNSNNPSQSAANSQMFTDLNKKPTVNKSTWGNQGLNSDYSDSLWNTGANSGAGSGGASGAAGKPRPPPGLSQVKNSNSSNSNSIWNSGLSSSSSNSEYLRLRNLTPQIDGSTLKTLCLQHGPLHLFHLFLNHGTAIARYSNRDQAIKAQSALNNCVLGNTTILADLPAESEVQQYLQLINGGGHSSNPSGQQSSNGSTGGSSGHHGHQSQQQQSQSAQSSAQQAQSHHQHHAAHHSQPYNSSWSNGTNASQSTAGAGSVSAGAQSTNPQSQHSSLYSRANSVGSGGQVNSGSTGSHLSPFGTAPAPINSFSSLQSTSSPASTLPYGAAGTGAPGLVTTHSSSSLPYHNVLNQASAASAAVASQFNKMDNGLLSSWNTGTGSSNLWDSSSLGGPVGGAAGLWSTAGFSAADRNTPIQNFLPGDLLAGENN